MNYLYEAIQPTRLYIKQCPHCGLKYFGKTTNNKIEKYPGSGKVWSRHLKKHRVKPVHLWSSDWYYDTSITRFALKFSRINKIVESKFWANIKDETGLDGGDPGPEGNVKHSNTLNSLKWKETTGKQKSSKQSQTLNDTIWKDTIGKEKSKNQSNTLNDDAWKDTIGKEKIQKYRSTVNDEHWKDTIGREKISKFNETLSGDKLIKRNNNISKTRNDETWKETIGKEAAKKCSDTKQSSLWKETTGVSFANEARRRQNDEEWKRVNFKCCNFCGKNSISPGNYSRWHGKNCKSYDSQSML